MRQAFLQRLVRRCFEFGEGFSIAARSLLPPLFSGSGCSRTALPGVRGVYFSRFVGAFSWKSRGPIFLLSPLSGWCRSLLTPRRVQPLTGRSRLGRFVGGVDGRTGGRTRGPVPATAGRFRVLVLRPVLFCRFEVDSTRSVRLWRSFMRCNYKCIR